MSKFLQLLNWRLIVINLLTFWFFYHGIQTLAFLKDPAFGDPLLNGIIKVSQKPRYEIDKNFIEQFGNIGMILAYVLAWYVAWKKDWNWVNGVIAFVVAFALGYFNWAGWNNFSDIFAAPGRLFNGKNGVSIWSYIVDGGILIGLGLLLLFWKRIQRFIDKGQYVDQAALEAQRKKKRTR